MNFSKFGLSFAAAAFLPAIAFAAPEVTKVETEKGAVLGDKDGMSLYTFKKDEEGVSNCYEDCAAKWPPFTAAEDAKPAGDYTIVERKDGTKQWAKDGMPLYYWIKDEKAGDISGDGVKEVWDLARP